MSHSVSFYIENKEKDGRWHLLNKSSLVWDFETYYIDNHIDFDEFGYIENSELSEELKEKYKIGVEKYDYITAKVTNFSELWEMANEYDENFEKSLEYAYLALGVPYRYDEYDENFEDKFDDEGKLRHDYNPLTFPVNKEILVKLNDYFYNIRKAYKIEELCARAKDFYNIDCKNEENYRIILILC